MELQSKIIDQTILFLFHIGRWAASELKERWKLARQRKNELTDQVDLSNQSDETQQQAEILLNNLASEKGSLHVEQVMKLVERKHDLIAEWQGMKVDNEEEHNRQQISRAALKIRQQELDKRITDTLIEIQEDLKDLGLQVEREAIEV